MKSSRFIGTGLYSISEASKLTGVSGQRISRWLRGYNYRYKGQKRRSKAIWSGQIEPLEGIEALGFLDLIEICFVDQFVKLGLSIQTIRKAAEKAYEWFEIDHPFTTQRFRTDGKRVFVEIEHDTGDTGLYDLIRNQFGLYDIILPSLYQDLRFDKSGRVSVWHPKRETPLIALDPKREFGQPIIETVGIQTLAIADVVRAEGGSLDSVAKWFEIEPDAVRQAVEFEFRYAA